MGSSSSHVGVVQATGEDFVTIDVGSRGDMLQAAVEVEATSGSFDWVLTRDGEECWAGSHDQETGEVVFEFPAKKGRWTLRWKMTDFSGDFWVRVSSVGR